MTISSRLILSLTLLAGACATDMDSRDADDGVRAPGGKADYGAEPGPDAGEATAALCEDRTGGALVTFTVAEDPNEMFTAWIEDDAFIDEAIRLIADGETRVPNFAMADGMDCDGQWSWHVDPVDAVFADFTIEVCDSLPSYIEDNKEEWFAMNPRWCPWGARMVSVDDRRVGGE